MLATHTLRLTELSMFLRNRGIQLECKAFYNHLPLKYQPWVSSAAWDDWKTLDLERIYMYSQGGQPEWLLEQLSDNSYSTH